MPATTTSAPVLELLAAWLGARDRTYAETMAAWTTHCPRLPVWEDAVGDGLIDVVRDGATGSRVRLTAAGTAVLER